MEREKIIEVINNFLVDEFEADRDEITAEANMKETLGLDSLDYIDMVVVIESNFGVKMEEADFKSITSFKEFYDIIEEKIKEKDLA